MELYTRDVVARRRETQSRLLRWCGRRCVAGHAGKQDVPVFQSRAGVRADACALEQVIGDTQPPASPDDDELAVGTARACLLADPPVANVDGAVCDRRRGRIVTDG